MDDENSNGNPDVGADFFKPFFSILKVILYWPLYTSKSQLLQHVHMLLSAVKVTFTVVLYIFLECFTVYKRSNLQERLAGSFMMFTDVSYLTKVLFFIINRKKILLVFKAVSDDVFSPKDTLRKEMITTTMTNWKKVFYIYITNCCFTVTLWAIIPSLQNGSIVLPYNYHYPFDVTSSPAREFAYIYEAGILYLIVVSHVSLDALMVGIMAFISAQLDVLNYNLRGLNNLDEVNSYSKHQFLKEEQIRCMIFHKKVMRLVKMLNQILAVPLVTQSCFGAIILCLSLYKLSTLNPLSGEGLSFINYYFGMLIQLSVYFWYGNEIIWKSNELSRSAYQCKWVNTSKPFRRHLLFFMLSTREPLKIYGGRVLELSLQPLISILKFSYSCYTLLKSV
uniref:Odorant receptor n=1 Tax=Anomala corpulenta TaxID=931571 RepID=A0A0E3Y5A0_9SCAR|nr:odorant receptor 3 [Anomala corpulenta]